MVQEETNRHIADLNMKKDLYMEKNIGDQMKEKVGVHTTTNSQRRGLQSPTGSPRKTK